MKRKDLIEDLRDQCADSTRFRDSDLVGMITKVEGITYTKDRAKNNVFRGIKRATKNPEQQQCDFCEPDEEIFSSQDC